MAAREAAQEVERRESGVSWGAVSAESYKGRRKVIGEEK